MKILLLKQLRPHCYQTAEGAVQHGTSCESVSQFTSFFINSFFCFYRGVSTCNILTVVKSRNLFSTTHYM
jgi:hypothetical protein